MSNGERIYTDSEFIKSVMSAQGSDDYVGSKKNYDSWMFVRTEDINHVLNEVLDNKIPGEEIEKIARERIYLIGHSLGGSAVLKVGRDRKEDVKGVIALESPFFGDIIDADADGFVFNEDGYPTPLLNIYSDASWEHLGDWETYYNNVKFLKRD